MQQLAIFALPKSMDETDDEGEDEDEESTEDTVLGSFESNPDHADAIGLHRNLSPLTETEFSGPANNDPRNDTSDIGDSNTEDPLPVPSPDGAEIHEPPPVSKEQCLSIFERFIDNQKPGLRALYKDSVSLTVQATEGVAIIEQLVRDGCSVETASDLVLLTLYRIAILTGFYPSLSVNIWSVTDLMQ